MKRFRFFFLRLFFLFCASFLFARPASDSGSGLLTVYAIKGPSGIGMVRMIENPPVIPGMEVRVEALAQSNLIAARFISGEAKAGILPPDVAAKIASAGVNIQIAAVTGYGMLSLLSSDPLVKSMDDLRGKRVELAGAGATPEYVFRRLLLNRGIDPQKDITLGYALSYPEIAQSLIAGRISTALLPEPFATIARLGGPGASGAASPEIRQIGDIQEEWKKMSGGDYPMTVFVFNGDFVTENPGASSSILRSLKDSILWTVSNPGAAGELAEKHGMGLRAGLAAEAIPRSNYVFIPAREARSPLESLYRTFLEFSPESLGGTLPSDNFYREIQP